MNTSDCAECVTVDGVCRPIGGRSGRCGGSIANGDGVASDESAALKSTEFGGDVGGSAAEDFGDVDAAAD